MSTILFWNQGRNPATLEPVADLVQEHQVDVVLLAEQPPGFTDDEVGAYLNATLGRSDFTAAFRPPRSRICALSALAADQFRTLEYDETFPYATFYAIGDCTLVAAHLISQAYADNIDRYEEASRLGALIREHESRRVGDERTLVVGDLNIDPFEDGIVKAAALNAVFDRRVATARGRIVKGQRYPFFYNAMWSLWGDRTPGPCGTYFFNRSGQHLNRYWHMLDQVLVRPALMDALTDVRIIDHVRGRSLCDPHGRPDRAHGSDHFPIIFKLEFPDAQCEQFLADYQSGDTDPT